MRISAQRLSSLFTSVFLMVCATIPQGHGRPHSSAPDERARSHDGARPSQARAGGLFGKLPLSFEANHGQADSKIKFISRGSGYTLTLISNEAVMQFRESVSLKMRLAGANAKAKARGLDELPGKSSYFIGNDPKRWKTGVPNYARVEYKEVYRGVDLVYYGRGSEIEYDFVIKPGADPREIRIMFEGHQSMRVEESGDLVLSTRAGEMRQRKPTVYQEIEGSRIEISSYYVIRGKNRVGFRIAGYDRKRPLIIDPVLSYSTYLGGNSEDLPGKVAVDSSGNVYMTGSTSSTTFPTSTTIGNPGVFSNGVFITKLNPAGTAVVYSAILTGADIDEGRGIAVDAAGCAYVTGVTSSRDFPTLSAFQPAMRGVSDAFVAKLNSSGTALEYSTYLGGTAFDEGQAIAIDPFGSAYVTGLAFSSNFPTTQGAFKTAGSSDAFVTKLSPSGSSLVYSTYLGGSASSESGLAIAVDSQGYAYVTGRTAAFDFPTLHALQPDLKGHSAFKSITGGGEWAITDEGLGKRTVLTLAIDPLTPATIYAGVTPGAVFKSTNGGNSWQATNSGLPVSEPVGDLVVDPINPSIVYVNFENQGIFKTTDGGESWREANNGIIFRAIRALVIDPLAPTTLYAGGLANAIYKTTDGGASWKLMNSGVNGTSIFSLAIDPQTPATVYAGALGRRVYKTTDGGQHWSRIQLDGSANISTLAIDPQTPTTVYAGTGGDGVLKSTDGGESWVALRGDNPIFFINALAIDPSSTSTLYAIVRAQGVFKSTDGGENWADATARPLNLGTTSLVIDPIDTDTLYVGTGIPAEGFLTKLNQSGSALVYSTYLGGNDTDNPHGIAIDVRGNVYVTGLTRSIDFPTSAALQPAFGGGRDDAFISKISASGTSLVYSTYFGGSGFDMGKDIAVDQTGDAYIVGDTNSEDLPTARPIQSTLRGFQDAFVMRLNSTGQTVTYSTYLGGGGVEFGTGIAVDQSGAAYIVGHTTSEDFPTTPGVFDPGSGFRFNTDAFITRIEDGPQFDICIQDDASGNILQFSSTTGDYRFFDCRKGITLTGRGTVTSRSCKIEMRHSGTDPKRPDRNVAATTNTCARTGAATVQIFAIGRTFTLSDVDTSDNSCRCSAIR